VIGGPRASSSSLGAAAAESLIGVDLVFVPSFLLCFLMTGGGAEGAGLVDMSAGGSTWCAMSTFRFFLGGGFGFVNLGVSDGWAGVVIFAFFAFSFLASSRRAFRRA